MTSYCEIAAAFEGTGISVRGGFREETGETIVLLGNAGPDMWAHFEAGRRQEPDPLDSWTRRVVDPIAAHLGARAVHPNDRPYAPFQRWAQRAEAVHPSPLGLLIHPEHGLWHAYRAALVFQGPVEGAPARSDAPSPCETCAEKPCLSACPVGAFTGTRYDVDACAAHLRGGDAPRCMTLGCRARDACPIGRAMRYCDAQIRFHMEAFLRARR
jgi:ferredoxin